MRFAANVLWTGVLHRHPDEHLLDSRLSENEMVGDCKGVGAEDGALADARISFHNALSRMKVLRASYEAACRRQEQEQRVFQEQFHRTRKELLTAYRRHRSLIRNAQSC